MKSLEGLYEDHDKSERAVDKTLETIKKMQLGEGVKKQMEDFGNQNTYGVLTHAKLKGFMDEIRLAPPVPDPIPVETQLDWLSLYIKEYVDHEAARAKERIKINSISRRTGMIFLHRNQQEFYPFWTWCLLRLKREEYVRLYDGPPVRKHKLSK